jgi:hypothetical protein
MHDPIAWKPTHKRQTPEGPVDICWNRVAGRFQSAKEWTKFFPTQDEIDLAEAWEEVNAIAPGLVSAPTA